MSEIPEHIMEQARAAWSRAFHVGPEVETIAEALLAAEKRGKEEERERCAKIAEAEADISPSSVIVPAVARHIAAAIRGS